MNVRNWNLVRDCLVFLGMELKTKDTDLGILFLDVFGFLVMLPSGSIRCFRPFQTFSYLP